jgi:flavodoxin
MMYGNTHRVAESIAEGLGGPDQVTVVPVAKASREPAIAAPT